MRKTAITIASITSASHFQHNNWLSRSIHLPMPSATPCPPHVDGRRALLLLVLKLAFIFTFAVVVVLWLCALLVRRVRALDAARQLPTSTLDSLSVSSFSSLHELQRSHETFQHVFDVEFSLALLCFTCFYVLKQVRFNHVPK